MTVLTDRETKKVVGIDQGKSQVAFNQALVTMEVRGAGREDDRSVTVNTSKSYTAGVSQEMPQANIVIDRFHITKLINEAIDEISRQEQRLYNELNGSRYLWLRNNASLTVSQREKVDLLAKAYPTLKRPQKIVKQFKYLNYKIIIYKNTFVFIFKCTENAVPWRKACTHNQVYTCL